MDNVVGIRAHEVARDHGMLDFMEPWFVEGYLASDKDQNDQNDLLQANAYVDGRNAGYMAAKTAFEAKFKELMETLVEYHPDCHYPRADMNGDIVYPIQRCGTCIDCRLREQILAITGEGSGNSG